MMTTIAVEGMGCEHCKQTVEEASQYISGFSDARAEHKAEYATIEDKPDSAALVRGVKDAGYDASVGILPLDATT